MMNECQSVGCNNVGVKVTAKVEVQGKMEIHDIYMCRMCIGLVNAKNEGFKN